MPAVIPQLQLPSRPPALARVQEPPCSRRGALLAGAALLQQLAPPGATQQAAASQQQRQEQTQQQGRRTSAAAPPPGRPAPPPRRRGVLLASIQADYDTYAPSYDVLDGGGASEALGFPQLRAALLERAHGDVLEVGVGTGLNLPWYPRTGVVSITGLDVSEGMLAAAAARGAGAAPPGAALRLVRGDASALPFPDASFDVVADTFSMCVFERPDTALAEMARVLRPGGLLLLLEHTRSDVPLLGAYQGATRTLVAALSKGCDWGQDVPSLVSGLPGVRVRSAARHLAGSLVTIVAEKA